jgi:hypothetical protein
MTTFSACARRTAVIAAATGVTAVALASPASAENFAVSVVCRPVIAEHCITPFLVKVDNHGEGIFVEFTASPEHCSSIVATITIDGTNLATEQLAPGQVMSKQFVPGTDKPGKQLTTVGVKADGVRGGCNIGALPAWKGTLSIQQF